MDATVAQAEAAAAREEDEPLPRGIAVTPSLVHQRWPFGRIPFEISSALPNKSRVTDAIDHWEANTVIRFVPQTTQTNYVSVEPADGICRSAVGLTGG